MADGPRRPAGGTASFDLVIGNPPFQGQLGRATARSAVDRDRAARALDAPGQRLRRHRGAVPGGRLRAGRARAAPSRCSSPRACCPLADAAPVRERVQTAGRLRAAWVAGERVFEAAVRVWAPVVDVGALAGRRGRGARRRRVRPGRRSVVARRSLVGRAPRPGAPHPGRRSSGRTGGSATWPPPPPGSVTSSTGSCPYVGRRGRTARPLVTSGADRPAVVLVGRAADPLRRTRLDASRRRPRPRWPPATRPSTGGWPTGSSPRCSWPPRRRWSRRSPTRRAGSSRRSRSSPSRPTPTEVWAVTAALSAPPVAAWALRRAAGAALAADAVKLSAKQILEVPLPVDDRLWAEVAARLAAGDLRRAEFADPHDPRLRPRRRRPRRRLVAQPPPLLARRSGRRDDVALGVEELGRTLVRAVRARRRSSGCPSPPRRRRPGVSRRPSRSRTCSAPSGTRAKITT